MKHFGKFLILCGCTFAIAATPPVNDVITFFSLNHAIRQGQYDEVTTAGMLKTYGNFGLGSEERLASELVMIDGVPYGIASDGAAHPMKDTTGIAFAVVKTFAADTSVLVKEVNSMDALKDFLDTEVNQNRLAAVRIEGTFTSITYRSYVAQEKPYKPIEGVEERFFTKKRMKGTLLGFYTPASLAVMNSPVYHFHFINDDRTTGGHVTDCYIADAKVSIDYSGEMRVLLPGVDVSDNMDLRKTAKQQK